MLVKLRCSTNHIIDLEETFNTLQKYTMKLNPIRYTFGVTLRKLLEFIVSSHCIEANPEKIRAIQKMTALKIIKEVQCLTGKVAALNRFVLRLAECCMPFFQVLK